MDSLKFQHGLYPLDYLFDLKIEIFCRVLTSDVFLYEMKKVDKLMELLVFVLRILIKQISKINL